MLGESWGRGVWFLISLVALSGCSKKVDATAHPEPVASSSAAPATALSAPPPAPPKSLLEYSLVQKFDGSPRFFQLNNGLLVCSDCDIGAKPNNDRHVFVYDGTDVKELPGLLSDKKISASLGASVTQLLKPLDGGVYRFTGELPKPLFVEVYGMKDDDNIERNGAPYISRYLESQGKSWVEGGIDISKYPTTSVPSWDTYEAPRALPRAYDEALLHAPETRGWAVVGGKGPLLIVRDDNLERWDGKAWTTEPAIWSKVRLARRFADGRSLVFADGGLFAISAEGAMTRVAVGDTTDAFNVYLINGKPWVTTRNALYVPADKALALADLPKREPAPARPSPPVAVADATPGTAPSVATAPSAMPAPSATAAPAASAAAVLAPSGITAMTGFSASCKTPFVVLFTPPSPNWSYSEAAGNLVGAAELQDKLWFAQFTNIKATYFGAQAADEAAARALIAAYVERVPKAKPILGCLDVKAYLPNPYEPKWDAERVLINLRAGSVL